MNWKDGGSSHYKTGGVEPIDLYYALGIGDSFVFGNIIKYAARMTKKGVNIQDINKIRHYCDILEYHSAPVIPDKSWLTLKDKLP